MKQNEAPVAAPNHVDVGTSTYGERTPPTTLPCSSTTVVLLTRWIHSARGGAMPVRTQRSRFCRIASNETLVGKRLRGPSLQFIGGGVRPALTMSAGRAE